MPVICTSCGACNRDNARFCQSCAQPLASDRPSSDDQTWLAAQLLANPATTPKAVSAAPEHPALLPGTLAVAAPTAAPLMRFDEEFVMDAPPAALETPSLFAGRYEIVATSGDMVEAIDRQPWRRCWSCNTTLNDAGEAFCTQCGAALDDRRYRGQITTGAPIGLALVPHIADPAALAFLPPIWDQVSDGDRTLTLTPATNPPTPLTLPLSELEALFIGRDLAHLLTLLHNQGFALGAVEPDDLDITPARATRLRHVRHLHRADGEDVTTDLFHLAVLLEALTATPRTTRRLDEEEVALDAAPTLADILREIRTGRLTNSIELEQRFDFLIAYHTAPAPLRVRFGAATDTGVVRDLNEDSLLALDLRLIRRNQPRTWSLFIVADGMGGHSAGEVASDLALRGALEIVQREYLAPTVDADAQDREETLREVVRRAMFQANEYVVREARNRGNDMGTTMTLALVAGDRAVIGNVGDSRTYLLREGKLRRVTRDHSLVQRLVDLGQITPDEVYTHPQRNAVLRSLGDKLDIEVDVFVERLRPGDALLLASDGLWEMVRDEQMAEIIAAHPDDPQAACMALIDAANAAGGDDNITVILAFFELY
ncbi:MAG: Stp1/IreP family PP2C-type Ser/Thr phosphatase [Roseiflexaceae bacterium]|nr:Stp1/IreP family PP2C-type Ser/Thr phosphatase [Roseiflexaceae bacterium]